ncbi:hypothetical protein F5X99DRAFT_66969 [Biscogniauxia marginata]|nr:hypothetical protein F5X99DRAFT_66969 [Biscogniauxia marginata]
MQGDIFQMEQTLASQPQVQVQLPHPSTAPKLRTKLYSTTEPQAHIYNEDDLSHLLFVDEHRHPRHRHHHHHHEHQHHFHNNEKILVNNVVHDDEEDDAGLTPPEFLSPLTGTTGTHTPVSGSETPVLSDCESDVDTGAEADNDNDDDDGGLLEPLSPHHHRDALAREDGFEFPVFLGRQSDDEDLDADDEDAVLASWKQEQQQQRNAWPATSLKKKAQKPLQVEVVPSAPALPGEQHVSAIDGPMMSWWPAPVESMEHEWVTDADEKAMRRKMGAAAATTATGEETEKQEGVAAKKVVLPAADERHREVVSDISGPLMTWWPAPAHLLEHEWIEAFYE